MIDESRLDDPEALQRLDSWGVLRALAGAGADVRRTRVLAAEAGVDRLADEGRPRAVLVASVGGAAAVGDVVELLAGPSSPVAVATRPNVPLPGWVGPLDLVVAVTASGRAPGPVALAAEAGRRGAALLTVGEAGSPLHDVCARAHGVHVDPGVPAQRRSSLWSLMIPALLGLARARVIDPVDDVLDDVADALDAAAGSFRPASEAFVNPAKDLALFLADTVPVVLGDGPLTGVAAGRAAATLARTAHIPATWGVLPDAASQVVACFDGPYAGGPGSQDLFADPFIDGPPERRLALLMFRDVLPDPVEPGDADRHNLAQAVLESAGESGVAVRSVETEDRAPLARLAGVLALADYTATYLALALGQDPAVSAHVAALRDRTR